MSLYSTTIITVTGTVLLFKQTAAILIADSDLIITALPIVYRYSTALPAVTNFYYFCLQLTDFYCFRLQLIDFYYFYLQYYN